MRIKILAIILGLVIGLPAVALGGSFTVSLIQGKTPGEAVQILAEQFDLALGRVENLETQQVQTSEDMTAAQLEIERLRLENDNLRLKTDAVISSTAGIRAENDRHSRCAELGAQISAKINAVKDPYMQLSRPILDELRKLRAIQRGLEPIGPNQDINEINSQAKANQEKIDAISIEMERAIQNLQNTPEMKALTEEAYKLLCA